ncbi:MAG: Gfo/Idh/MocA family oxidoreductase [Clostridia bacterium]|nr:Gfo/Idh/MocA family oxidoreductase [Clostridia bacterium]
MKTVACIGVGNRGSKYLLELNIFHKKEIKPVAICDIKPEKLVRFGKKYKIADDMRFQNDDAFFDKGVLADGLIISTPDKEHFRHAKRAIEVGYKTILLEKPVSKYIEETKEIARLADEYGAKVVVCHVLRYSNYYLTLKNAVESGALGRVISVEQRENVGYFHFAHSYVRGEWHNEADSSPSILAKCCHDLDLIYWFAGAKPVSVDSYGNLFTSTKTTLQKAPQSFVCKDASANTSVRMMQRPFT